MSRIKRGHTKPELGYKRNLRRGEYQPKGLFGNPDFVDWRNKRVFFVDGCFWHKCPLHWNEPKSNRDYWISKLERNEIRGREVSIAYKTAGWKVIRVWEHDIKIKN